MYRSDFPIFRQHPKLIYFDNAATHQMPRSVISAIQDFYKNTNANPLRGLYDLSVAATRQVEQARATVASYINAKDPKSIIFTRSTTDSLNLASIALTRSLSSDDEIVVFQENHHSQILPWAELCTRIGAHLKVITYHPDGVYSLDKLEQIITPNARVVAVSAMSNVTGQINQSLPMFSQIARGRGAHLVVDAAQAVAHTKLDIAKIQPDFLAFSGHKIGAPTGIGVLYCRPELLNTIRPAYFGGGMVDAVHLGYSSHGLDIQLAQPPHCFEAGTINTGGIVGLDATIKYWQSKNPTKLFAYIDNLTTYFNTKAKAIPSINILFAEHGIITFNLNGVHPHDVAQVLAENHIAVRAGYHCAQPLHDILESGPTVRASLSFYNTKAEIDNFLSVLKRVRSQLGYD